MSVHELRPASDRDAWREAEKIVAQIQAIALAMRALLDKDEEDATDHGWELAGVIEEKCAAFQEVKDRSAG